MKKHYFQLYGVYKFDKYPDWNILIIGFEDFQDRHYIKGLAFCLDGTFDMMITVNYPDKFEQIGYIYTPIENFKLKLEKVNGTNY